MNQSRLDQMIKGWFVGDFEPTMYQSSEFEAGVKCYKAGDYEEKHHHRVATEITVIASGEVKMGDRLLRAGDIILIEPGEATDFLAVTDAITVVVKVPSVSNDKYPGERSNA